MRKALIFVGAFIVSTIVIYSVWYYSQMGKYQGGIVVTAEELPNTVIADQKKAEKPNKNFILFTGLQQALQSPALSAEECFPDSNRILTNNSYSLDLEEKLNVEISRKFPGHPP